jgi:two-component system nitrogen regulation sensor histidine kinase NtrY
MLSRQRLGATIAFPGAFVLGVGFWAAIDRSLWATAAATGLLAMLAALPALSRLARMWSSQDGGASAGRNAEDRRSAEVRLRWLAHVLDLVPTALVSRGADGRLLALNRASRALFGTDGPILDAPADLVRVAAGRLVADATPLLLGTPHARAYAASLAEIGQDDGPARLIALADIEEQLRAQDASTLKDTLDVLSHEIMNSLTPVTSLAQTAQGLLADGDREGAREALAVLERRASGLLRFVESYRALARLPQPVLRPIAVPQLIADVRRLFEGHDQIDDVVLELSLTPDVMVTGDPDLMAQALINLLLNAAQAAIAEPVGGEPARVRLSAIAVDDGVWFQVSDNGPGLGDLDPQTILKPFFTRRSGGAGIGLSLVSGIVVGHGSALEFGPSELGPTGLGVGFTLMALHDGETRTQEQ